MTICYSVFLGTSLIFKLGDYLEGCGKVIEPRWDNLDCTDCVWIVPGTELP